jgi:serine/threonine protein kinase/tetratricopeptide (TPR) repeat protein
MIDLASDTEAVFLAALDKPTQDQRIAYVEGVCGGNAQLLARVRELLAAHAESQGPLDAPPLGLAAGLEAPGMMVGPYKLLQVIGEGGMGTVYMAEQTQPVRRKVALKIIKAGMDSRQVSARFEAERQALALMDHPNIAKVLDAGTVGSEQWTVDSEEPTADSLRPTAHRPLPTAGRPYFVMELVKGVPVTNFCDEGRLTPKQRLELFVPVCQAVQHAHQKGIIHRDLKPSNVMVCLYDGKPVPKIIDFGVAKATGPKLTDKTLYTEFGSVVGTLEYMSPEQAELNQLDIDTRSDIYSLGVLLYELLTGTTPLERGKVKDSSLLELLRIIREEEPPKPSMRLSAIEELPSIAANRSLEPNKLSGLVRGELDWIVLKALEKDRNRRYQTASGIARDIQRYLNDEPVEACPPSAGYRLRKYAWRHKAALAISAVLATALLLIVGTVAGSLGWVLRDKDARRARTDDAVQAALREVRALQSERKWSEALAGLQRVEELLAPMEGSPDLEQSVRDLRVDLEMVGKLDEIRARQGEVKRGVQDFAQTDAAYARAFRDYGIDCDALDAAEAGERVRSRAIAVELTIILDEWASVRRYLGKEGSRGWKHLLAIARLADPDPWRVRLRDALEFDRPEELVALANSKEVPDMPLRTLQRLGKALAVVKKWDEAARLLLEAQRLYPNDFWTNSMLAWALDQQQPPRSVAAARYATVAASLRDDNELLHFNLGWYLERAGQFDDAVAAYARAIRLNPDYAEAYGNLARALASAKDVGPAVAIYRDAAERKPDWPQGQYFLGTALKKKGDLDGAAKAFREALRLGPAMAAAREELVNILSTQGKDADIETVYTASLAALDEAVLRGPKDLAGHVNLAWLLTTCPVQKLRDPARALVVANRAVEIGPGSEVAWQVLGWAHYRNRAWKASIEALEKSMKLQKNPQGGDSWQWFFLAMAHWQLGHREEARSWYQRAANWLEKNAPDHLEGKRFQAEAAGLLELDAKPVMKPASK